MTDLFRLLDRLEPPQDGESPVRHRTGTVDAVNSDGTVDLDLGGVVVDSVAVLAGAFIAVGATVQVAVWRGDLLVLGRIGHSRDLWGRETDFGPTAIGTSATTLLAATLDIPLDWKTWGVTCWWQLGLVDSSGGNTGTFTTVTVFVERDSAQVGSFAQQEFEDSNSRDVQHMSGITFEEGVADTGPEAWVLRASRGGAPTINAFRMVLVVHAQRVT